MARFSGNVMLKGSFPTYVAANDVDTSLILLDRCGCPKYKKLCHQYLTYVETSLAKATQTCTIDVVKTSFDVVAILETCIVDATKTSFAIVVIQFIMIR